MCIRDSIVDEALAVGDEAFQRKCFARIQRLRDDGSTILFVSHSAGIVTELCDRAILLDQGEVLALGGPKSVVSKYHKLIYSPADSVEALRAEIKSQINDELQSPDKFVSAADRVDSKLVISAKKDAETKEDAYYDEGMVPQSTLSYSSNGVSIDNAQIETLDGRRVNVIQEGEAYNFVYEAEFAESADKVRFGMMIRTTSGLELGGAVSSTTQDAIETVEKGTRVKAVFPFVCQLMPAMYFLNAGVLAVVDGQEQFLDRKIDIGMFRVLPNPSRLSTGLTDLVESPDLWFSSTDSSVTHHA